MFRLTRVRCIAENGAFCIVTQITSGSARTRRRTDDVRTHPGVSPVTATIHADSGCIRPTALRP